MVRWRSFDHLLTEKWIPEGCNFWEKMLSTGILVDTGEKDEVAKHRAGMLYEFNKEQYDAMKMFDAYYAGPTSNINN